MASGITRLSNSSLTQPARIYRWLIDDVRRLGGVDMHCWRRITEHGARACGG
jgi:hypothetical protein